MASQLGQGGLACCSPRGRDQASGPMCVDQSDLSVKASLDASSLRFPLLTVWAGLPLGAAVKLLLRVRQ